MYKFKLEYINSKGETIELYGRPFRLVNVTGLGDVEAEIQMQKAPYQDGATLIDTALEPRYIDIEIKIIGSNTEDTETKRRKVASIFNPRLKAGTLRYISDSGVREIKAIATALPNFPDGSDNRQATFQKALIQLVAPDPHWKDIIAENYKLEDFVGNFRFKFRFPVRFATRGDSRILINKGDVPTPIVVEFRGAAVNPKITNVTTGEFIKVNRTIPPGYKLVLDTSFGNKRVEIVAPDGVVENAFHYIDLESTFFSLEVGETKFGFITEGGNPEVYVEYKHRYLSV